MTLRRTIAANILMITTLCVVGLSACSYDEETIRPVKVGAAPWIGYEPLFLARELGFYGLGRVKLVELSSSTETLNLLREDMLDVAALTLDEALVAIEEGTRIKIILAVDSSNGADVLMAYPQFATMEALKGHKIGVENNAVGALLLQSALTASHMKVQDIQVVPLQGEQMIHAYDTHQVDAVVTYNPKSILLKQQGAQTLFDSSQIPNKIIDVLVVREDKLDAYRHHVQSLISGYFKAYTFFKSHPKQAMEMIAPRLHLTPQEVEASFQGVKLLGRAENKALFAHQVCDLYKLGQELQMILLKKELLQKPVNSRQIFDDTFVLAD